MKWMGCAQLLEQLAFLLVCPSCSLQTMTRMKTSVRMMMAPPADAAGEPAMMESMKSGAVLDLEEQVGGSRGVGCWARQRRGLLQPFVGIVAGRVVWRLCSPLWAPRDQHSPRRPSPALVLSQKLADELAAEAR